jgi:histidyl-tRNA synthetase
MLVADALEALGLARGDYLVKVNNRKVLNGILELIGVSPDSDSDVLRLTVLRAIDIVPNLEVLCAVATR